MSTLAGMILEQFSEVRNVLAEAYGVDESVALEATLYGNIDEDSETDEDWNARDISKDWRAEVERAAAEQKQFHGPRRYNGLLSTKDDLTLARLYPGHKPSVLRLMLKNPQLYDLRKNTGRKPDSVKPTHSNSDKDDELDVKLAKNKEDAKKHQKLAKAASKQKNIDLYAKYGSDEIAGK
jgi:hypothetical protein